MAFPVQLRAGEALADEPPAAGDDGVLLAVGLAESLAAQPGDTVTLMTLNSDGMLNALDVRVRGLITTGVADLDTRFLKLHLATSQRLLQTEQRLEPDRDLRHDRRGRGRAAGARPTPSRRRAISPWWTGARGRRSIDQVRNLYLGIFWFLGTVILVLVVLSVSNTLVMTVMERVREIGTLRAIGTSGGQIAGPLVLLEPSGSGPSARWPAARWAWRRSTGSTPPSLQDAAAAWSGFPIDLRLVVVPEAFAGTAALMLAVLALASLAPIARSLRLRIAEALAHV